MISAGTVWQVWRAILTAEGLFLALVGAVGLFSVSRIAGPLLQRDTTVLFFQPNAPHSVLLLVVGIIAMVAAQWPRSFVWWSAVQMVGFLLLFVWGTAQSTAEKASTPLSLDTSENFLHGALAALGFVFLTAGVNMLRRSERRDREGMSS